MKQRLEDSTRDMCTTMDRRKKVMKKDPRIREATHPWSGPTTRLVEMPIREQADDRLNRWFR